MDNMYEQLKKDVCRANCELAERKLVLYTWGNVSAIDRQSGVVAIKPSGVAYDKLIPEMMVLTRLDGTVLQSRLNPSSDCPTHMELYRCFPDINAVCHVHSRYATIWAQACRSIPCLGTTHADYFYGPIPVTDPLSEDEIRSGYELNTGKVIVRRFKDLDPLHMPAVLVANHGPFTWGPTAAKAVENAVVLEEVAAIALANLSIDSNLSGISQSLLDKHYLRKHGDSAYYGQNSDTENSA